MCSTLSESQFEPAETQLLKTSPVHFIFLLWLNAGDHRDGSLAPHVRHILAVRIVEHRAVIVRGATAAAIQVHHVVAALLQPNLLIIIYKYAFA